MTEGDNLGNTWQVWKKFPTRFESSVEGVLVDWKIDEGAVISKPKYAFYYLIPIRYHYIDSCSSADVAEIEEPCAHSVQFGGMCVTCGKDMSE